jgi:predicted nucleotidyltransferase
VPKVHVHGDQVGQHTAAAELVPEPLLKQVVSVLNPRRIILFGSRAKGEGRDDSDYDLVAVLDDDAPEEMFSSRRSYEARKGIHLPIDILPCRESTLQKRARAIGSFAHTILTEGVIVYERR